jgi:zona occludens toxin (predicted ATPase)
MNNLIDNDYKLVDSKYVKTANGVVVVGQLTNNSRQYKFIVRDEEIAFVSGGRLYSGNVDLGTINTNNGKTYLSYKDQYRIDPDDVTGSPVLSIVSKLYVEGGLK